MLERFLTYLRSNCSVSPGEHILLACSGGSDSMVLAELLLRSGQPFSIAHCNFQLRNENSDLDEHLVLRWCTANKIQLFVKRFETSILKKESGGSTQMVARELRYNWFRELLEENKFSYLATAHHLDDSIETFLINLSRGSGLKGLTGIDAKRDQLIRPLLFASKSELVSYAKNEGVVWREDQSNESDDYLRNRIRHHLVPAFEEENASWKNSMANTLEHLTDAAESLETYFAGLKASVCSSHNTFPVDKLLEIKPVGIFLHYCFNPYGFTPSQLKDLEDCLTKTEEKQFLAGEYRLVLSRGVLALSSENLYEKTFIIKDWQDIQQIPGVVSVNLEENSDKLLSSINSTPNNQTILSADLLDFPLTASHWTEGDRFTPLGMKGSKLVSDFFNDIKLNKIEKERQMILRSSKNGIIWIAGKRLDDRFKVRNDTRLVLRIEFEII